MVKKGLAKVEIITETDIITGEVTKYTKKELYEQYKVIKKQHKFAMIGKDTDSFLNIKTALDYKVLYLLVDHTNRNNQTVTLNKHLKNELAIKLGFTIKAIEKSIYSLVDVDALTPVSKGVYLINPEIIFMGGTVNIDNYLEEYRKYRTTYLEKKTNE